MTPDLLRRMQEQATGDVMRQQDAVGKGVEAGAMYQVQASTWILAGVVIVGFGIGYAWLDRLNRL